MGISWNLSSLTIFIIKITKIWCLSYLLKIFKIPYINHSQFELYKNSCENFTEFTDLIVSREFVYNLLGNSYGTSFSEMYINRAIPKYSYSKMIFLIKLNCILMIVRWTLKKKSYKTRILKFLLILKAQIYPPLFGLLKTKFI